MIIEPANIATETLYIFFLAVGLWLYIEYVADASHHRETHRVSPVVALTLAALVFGLATLTRAVAVLFPLGIALHLMLLGRHGYIRSWRKSCIFLLLVYSAFISTWTIYNLILWERIIIVSDQLMPALWRAAESNDGSPEQNDRLLMEGLENTIPEGCEIDCKFQHSTETFVTKIRRYRRSGPGRFTRPSSQGISLLHLAASRHYSSWKCKHSRSRARMAGGEPLFGWIVAGSSHRRLREQARRLDISLWRDHIRAAGHDLDAQAMANCLATKWNCVLHDCCAFLPAGIASLPLSH